MPSTITSKRGKTSAANAASSLTCQQADLAAQLTALGQVSGWLTETGRVVHLHEDTISLQNLPLAGEFFRADTHWQLTQLPRGQWQLTQHTLQPCPAEAANCLAERVSHLLAGNRSGQLHYWKLWLPGSDGAPENPIALLTAIEESRT